MDDLEQEIEMIIDINNLLESLYGHFEVIFDFEEFLNKKSKELVVKNEKI